MERITYADRQLIERYLKMKKSKKWIAGWLKKDYSVIKREIKRNSGDYLPYSADSAQRIADRRARKTNIRKLDKDEALKQYVIDRIATGEWSPEQIAGVLKNNLPLGIKHTLSHESIYQYLYRDQDAQTRKLWLKLKTRRRDRRPKGSRKHRYVEIKQRVSIHDRPKVITDKKRYGDWETDLIVGNDGQQNVQVLYERKMNYTLIRKVQNKQADEFEKRLQSTCKTKPDLPWKSITRDNGTENVLHYETKKLLKLPSYFCDPYCSWQKGGIENCNKLIRWYFPKKTKFENISDKQLADVEHQLNSRPRKNLNFLSPQQVLNQLHEQGALNP